MKSIILGIQLLLHHVISVHDPQLALVLVNRLGGLSLPRKSVVRLTDRPDMTLDIYRGRKTTMQQHATQLALTCITWSSHFALYLWLYLIDKYHTLDTF